MGNNHKMMTETDCIYCVLSWSYLLSLKYLHLLLLLLHLLPSFFSLCIIPLSFSHFFLTSPVLSGPPSDPVEMEYEEAVSKVTLQQIIRDLEPSTSYTFYVKAYTSHGASKPSDSATESTHGEGEHIKHYLLMILNMRGDANTQDVGSISKTRG